MAGSSTPAEVNPLPVERYKPQARAVASDRHTQTAAQASLPYSPFRVLCLRRLTKSRSHSHRALSIEATRHRVLLDTSRTAGNAGLKKKHNPGEGLGLILRQAKWTVIECGEL